MNPLATYRDWEIFDCEYTGNLDAYRFGVDIGAPRIHETKDMAKLERLIDEWEEENE